MNPLFWFQQCQRLYAICPFCGEVFRLSEAAIYIASRPPMTAFDRVRAAIERAETVAGQFVVERAALVNEDWERGVEEANRQLKAIAPEFVDRDIDPRDVRVLFDPVRYVAFRGLTQDNPTAIELIDDEPTTVERERFLRSLEGVLAKGNIDWATWRVTATGTVVCERK